MQARPVFHLVIFDCLLLVDILGFGVSNVMKQSPAVLNAPRPDVSAMGTKKQR